MGSSPEAGGARPPGMGSALSLGRDRDMKPCQTPAGAPPPVTLRIGVLSSRPSQTAATKPPV